jgi:hypothetical protein
MLQSRNFRPDFPVGPECALGATFNTRYPVPSNKCPGSGPHFLHLSETGTRQTFCEQGSRSGPFVISPGSHSIVHLERHLPDFSVALRAREGCF